MLSKRIANVGQQITLVASLSIITIVLVSGLLVWALLFRDKTENVEMTPATTVSQPTVQVDNGNTDPQTNSAAVNSLPNNQQDNSGQEATGALPQTGSNQLITQAVLIATLVAVLHGHYTRVKHTRSVGLSCVFVLSKIVDFINDVEQCLSSVLFVLYCFGRFVGTIDKGPVIGCLD